MNAHPFPFTLADVDPTPSTPSCFRQKPISLPRAYGSQVIGLYLEEDVGEAGIGNTVIQGVLVASPARSLQIEPSYFVVIKIKLPLHHIPSLFYMSAMLYQ